MQKPRKTLNCWRDADVTAKVVVVIVAIEDMLLSPSKETAAGQQASRAEQSHCLILQISVSISYNIPADPTPPTRFTKVEFPTFDGKSDPLVWLHHRCELFFAKSPHTDHEKVTTAAYYLLDSAQLWYKRRAQDGHQFSWTQFKDACTLRFGPPRSSAITVQPLGQHNTQPQLSPAEILEQQNLGVGTRHGM